MVRLPASTPAHSCCPTPTCVLVIVLLNPTDDHAVASLHSDRIASLDQVVQRSRNASAEREARETEVGSSTLTFSGLRPQFGQLHVFPDTLVRVRAGLNHAVNPTQQPSRPAATRTVLCKDFQGGFPRFPGVATTKPQGANNHQPHNHACLYKTSTTR